eukprot:scaffold1654_cov127-Skeletonema_menzelii.AAC.3
MATATASTKKNAAKLHVKSARAFSKSKPIDEGDRDGGVELYYHYGDKLKNDTDYYHYDAADSQPNSNAVKQPINNTESPFSFSFDKLLTCFSPGNGYDQSALARQAEDVQAKMKDAQKDMEAAIARKKKKLKAHKAKKAAAAKKAKEVDVAQEAANAKIKLHEDATMAADARYREAVIRADKAKKASEMKDKKAADALRQVTKLKVAIKVAEMEAKWAKKMAKKESKHAERFKKKAQANAIKWNAARQRYAQAEAAATREAAKVEDNIRNQRHVQWRPDDDSVETVLIEDDYLGLDEIGLHTDVEDLGSLMADMMEEASLLLAPAQ